MQKYEMLALNLPPYPFKISNREGKKFIFDVLRKKYVALTPEEWVRRVGTAAFHSFVSRAQRIPSRIIGK